MSDQWPNAIRGHAELIEAVIMAGQLQGIWEPLVGSGWVMRCNFPPKRCVIYRVERAFRDPVQTALWNEMCRLGSQLGARVTSGRIKRAHNKWNR